MRLSGVFILLLSGCVRYYASPPPALAETPAEDPPGRVARLSYLEGPVSFKAAGTDEWVAASLNRPLTIGDSLWTDSDARAELTIGTAALRLDSRTGVRILNLDDDAVQLSVPEGAVRFHVRSVEANETIEVDTHSAAISLLRSGDYRVEARPDSDAIRVVVRSGVADTATGGEPFVIRENQEAILAGANAKPDIRPAPPLDAFDVFCDRRESGLGQTETLRHVSREVVGWEDLDRYGSWEVDAAYGPLWIPRSVAAGWAPYRMGHWVWVHPWGWTWVDETPWGFAPFHYGRWVFLRARWCWVPGPPRVRVVYAPALVVFVGGGSPGLRYHVRIGVQIGIGWFPLGPHEIYIPPYRASRTYITRINVSHTLIRNRDSIPRTDVTRQVYANRRVAGAITAVPEDAFTRGGRIAGAAAPLPPREAAAVRVTGSEAPVAPGPRSVSGDPGETRVARPPDRFDSRPAVVRRTPAQAPPSFERRRPELERDPGRPLDRETTERLRREQPAPNEPAYRQVPESTGRSAAGQPSRTAPPAVEQRQDRRTVDRDRRDSEQRRETIEKERKQQPAPRVRQKRSAEPESRDRSKESGASQRREQ